MRGLLEVCAGAATLLPFAAPLIQDVNGPCPLLAIANVLLLRNQIQLPAGVGEVSQVRAVAVLVGCCLSRCAACRS